MNQRPSLREAFSKDVKRNLGSNFDDDETYRDMVVRQRELRTGKKATLQPSAWLFEGVAEACDFGVEIDQ